jgi:O-antigen ligase
MRIGRSPFSFPPSKYAPSSGRRPFCGWLTSDPAARRVAVWCEAGLDTTAVLFVPLLVLVPRSIAPLVSAAGLCAAGLVLSTRRLELRPAVAGTGMVLAGLLAWGTISAAWSIDPWRSLVLSARLAGIFAAGLALIAAADRIAAPRRLMLWLLGGLALGMAMAATELFSRGALGALVTERPYQAARLNQASVTFAILLPPVCAVLVCRGQKVCAVVFATATVATIYALAGTSAKATLTVGLALGALLYLGQTRAARAAAVISLVLVITAPLSFARLERLPGLTHTADAIKLSAGHRLLIWSFVGTRIAERPLVGWGLDSSRAIPGGKDPIRPGEDWLPLHPHNAPLQLWLELGVPGAVLFALLTAHAWVGLAAAPWPRIFAAATGASLTIALTASFTTYGIWQEWWLGTLWFTLFLILVMGQLARQGLGCAETPRLARPR